MKKYPSISKIISYDVDVIAFDKIDGSNIRVEWNKNKKQFYKFGSRTELIDMNSPILCESIDLIRNKYEERLSDIFLKRKYEKVICFFEFYGKSSFAGKHEVEKHDVILFDIAPHKKGILSPNEFISLVGDLEIPKIVFSGKLDSKIISKIKSSEFDAITFEGVVCKNNNEMFKIKTDRWLSALATKFGRDSHEYNEVA